MIYTTGYDVYQLNVYIGKKVLIVVLAPVHKIIYLCYSHELCVAGWVCERLYWQLFVSVANTCRFFFISH